MRTAFLVDGFNLYHSVDDVLAGRHADPPLKWLDVRSLCESIVRDAQGVPRRAVVSEIHYFSALATHLEARNPGIVARHRTYLRALEHTGVTIHLGQFKRTDRGHEEKETDVAIAVALLELYHAGAADCVWIMSGDTDLMPAVRAARRMFPGRLVCFAFPFRRQNNVLKEAADAHFRIRAHQYAKHQLPYRVLTDERRVIQCPEEWL